MDDDVFSSVADGAELSFGRIHITARHTPAHTTGHVVYILDGTPFHSPNSLFSGDLLFIAGTGIKCFPFHNSLNKYYKQAGWFAEGTEGALTLLVGWQEGHPACKN